jgi:hypothetical protein
MAILRMNPHILPKTVERKLFFHGHAPTYYPCVDLVSMLPIRGADTCPAQSEFYASKHIDDSGVIAYSVYAGTVQLKKLLLRKWSNLELIED